MRDTPRPQETADDTGTRHPQPRPGRAPAHTTGASGSVSPHRSDGRSSHTPRGGRHTGPDGRPGTSPPCSGAAEPFPGPARPVAFLALPLVLFALFTWQVVADGPLLRVDERVSRALVHPDRISELLADLGNVQVAVPVLLVAVGYAALRGRAAGTDRWWLPPLAAALLMALVPALVVPFKDWTARHGTPAVPPGTGYYPSGHTATAVVAYGTATLLLLPLLRTARARLALTAGCVAVTLGVAFGLVRRGYHWPLDVVASWCLGTALLTVFVLAVRTAGRGGTAARAADRGNRRPPGHQGPG